MVMVVQLVFWLKIQKLLIHGTRKAFLMAAHYVKNLQVYAIVQSESFILPICETLQVTRFVR